MDEPLTGAQLKKFQTSLLAWFRRHRRELPWRASRDPYRIWIAEVMLQQTRIAAVIPVLRTIPRAISGFSSARIRAAARRAEAVVRSRLLQPRPQSPRRRQSRRRERAGEFPRDLDAALALPGIGVYTAAAVLSIAYDVPLAVLDGNVARVLARVSALRGELRESKNWSALSDIAEKYLAAEAPGDWNQALMELGEVVCTPKSPTCLVCPVVHHCRAYALAITGEIPEPRRKRATGRK